MGFGHEAIVRVAQIGNRLTKRPSRGVAWRSVSKGSSICVENKERIRQRLGEQAEAKVKVKVKVKGKGGIFWVCRPN